MEISPMRRIRPRACSEALLTSAEPDGPGAWRVGTHIPVAW